MAYNNYFPQTYTSPTYSYGATAAPAQTWTTPAPSTSQQVNAINWVQGEAGAKSVPVAPGQKVLLMDSETNVFYVKSSDVSGMPLPLRIFEYKEVSKVANEEATAPAQITVPTAAASATTVATGSTTSSGSGASVVTGVSVGDTFNAVTGYASPTATIASGSTGDVTVATGIGAATTKYMSASASGTAVGADGSAQAITGITPTTDSVLGSGSTITVTPTTTNIKATATNGNVAWNSKDSVTVLTNTTDVDVTKG